MHTTFQNNLCISSDFCSGNLAKAKLVSHANHSSHVLCATKGDQHAEKYSTWFYFSVQLKRAAENDTSDHASEISGSEKRGASTSYTIQFTVQNINAQKKLFKQGMKPVVRCESGEWQRLQEKVSFQKMKNMDWVNDSTDSDDDSDDEDDSKSDKHEIKFKLTIPCGKRFKKWYVAYCFPWSLDDNDRMLTHYEQLYGSEAKSRVCRSKNSSKIYFHRETLTHTLEGRRMEVITVSSLKGIRTEEREPTLKYLYPDTAQERAFMFRGKKTYLLTARVHPGETPGSHIFNGFFKFILHPKDPRAAALRNMYVFKFIPILNPDGVSNGHYRADTQGRNLNRFYKEPTISDHPTIFATKSLAIYLAKKRNLFMYMDLHAHAQKRGHFIFGNSLPDFDKQLENVMYSKLVALNTQFLDFNAGNFSEKSMRSKDKRDGLSKDGTGRVGMYRHTGVTHCYTLEGNYYSGKSLNHIGELPATKNGRYAPDLPPPSKQSPKYTIEIFEDVGKGLCNALLDMVLGDDNPYSRISSTPLKNMAGVRKWTSKMLRRKKKFWKDASKKRQPIWERYNEKTEEEESTSLPKSKSKQQILEDSSDDDNGYAANSVEEEESDDRLTRDSWNRSTAKRNPAVSKHRTRVVSITEHTPPTKRASQPEEEEQESTPNSSETQNPQPELHPRRKSQTGLNHNIHSEVTAPISRRSSVCSVDAKPVSRKKATQKRLHGKQVVCHSLSSFERLTTPSSSRRTRREVHQSFNHYLVKYDPTPTHTESTSISSTYMESPREQCMQSTSRYVVEDQPRDRASHCKAVIRKNSSRRRKVKRQRTKRSRRA